MPVYNLQTPPCITTGKGIVLLVAGDPLKDSKRVRFHEYVQTEDKDIPGRVKVVGLKILLGE